MLRARQYELLLIGVASLLPAFLRAQNGTLWKEGSWSIEAPSGACGSLPLLQVKGPGSIFDPPQAAALASMEKALPQALASVCPTAREVIVLSGRTRRLLRLPATTAPSPAPTPVPAPAAVPPTAQVPAATPAATPVASPVAPPIPPPNASPTPAVTQASRRQPLAPAASSPSTSRPVFNRSSNLRSLSSANSAEDKCEVLLAWLESSKTGVATTAVSRYRQPAELLRIFRDEPMTAVFGKPYDQTENRWRLDFHGEVISRCLGLPGRRTGVFNRQPSRAMQQYAQQFQQYEPVLSQAFAGQPGPYEPTTISRHVQQIRTQTEWADRTMTEAASAPPSRDAFDRLTAQQQSASRELSLLPPAERDQVTAFLRQQQTAMAPALAEAWFREAAATPKGASSATLLQTSYSRIAPVIGALDGPARENFRKQFDSLMDSLIAEPLQSELAQLRAVPGSLAGVLEISAWKTRFDAAYQSLRGVPSLQAALHEYNQARARVLTGALPSWVQQVGALPVDGAAITSKRRDLQILFPAREDQASPVFTQYEAPLRAKEDQLRLRVEAELQKQQLAAANAEAARNQAVNATPTPTRTGLPVRNAPGAGLTEASLVTSGTHNQPFLTNIFKGDFDRIELRSDDMSFADMYGQYLRAFGSQCDAFLPRTKTEIMVPVCTARWVNGYGADRGCANWDSKGTGVFADPELYAVKKKLDMQAAMDVGRNALKLMTQRDPIAGAMNMAGNAIATNADMDALVRQNGCASGALKRFEDNFTRFALNKQPVRLGELGPKLSAIDPLPGIPFRDQDYSRLMEDLIQDQARGWAINRYIAGTAGGTSVTARDDKGRPAKISASYAYQGFSGRSQGSVTLTFSDGMPECMYFHDFPATCRTPSRRIAAAYRDGAYAAR